jgi:hypothetical protein
MTNSHQDSTMAQLPKRGTILLMKHFVRDMELHQNDKILKTHKIGTTWCVTTLGL